MQRRDFLANLPAAGLAADVTSSLPLSSLVAEAQAKATEKKENILEKVKLAMLGEEFALTHAASPGEAVLWTAKKTGDPVLCPDQSTQDKERDHLWKPIWHRCLPIPSIVE